MQVRVLEGEKMTKHCRRREWIVQQMLVYNGVHGSIACSAARSQFTNKGLEFGRPQPLRLMVVLCRTQHLLLANLFDIVHNQ